MSSGLGNEGFVWFGGALGAAMLVGLGANDVSNSCAMPVGTKALTMTNALVIAGVFEFLGAFLLGSSVSDTIRSDMIHAEIFSTDPHSLILVFVSALFGVSSWLMTATYFKLPVSTTHSVVGAVVFCAMASKGGGSINWNSITSVASSWVISPVFGAVVASLILKSMDLVFYRRFYREQGMAFYYALTASVVVAFFMSLSSASAFAGLVLTSWAFIGCFYTAYWYIQNQSAKDAVSNPADEELSPLGATSPDTSKKGWLDCDDEEFAMLRQCFLQLQVVSAAMVAFAHGSNDVSNAIGPFTAIIAINASGNVLDSMATPTWILVGGGLCIVLGLATLGKRVIETVGDNLASLSIPSGFAVQLGTAITVLLASSIGLPVSTTHVVVGAVMGIGIMRHGVAGINWGVIGKIAISWLVTIPAAGVASVLMFFLLA